MPSPVGHALGGLAFGWAVVPPGTRRAALVLAAVALAPDLDLLIGTHREISHSIGMAALAGAIAWVMTKKWWWAAAIALAWSSHIFLDWLSNDTRPPVGVMALWPFSTEYYKAPIEIFPPVSRRYWESRFWLYNLRALAAELVILGPLVLIIAFLRRRKWT